MEVSCSMNREDENSILFLIHFGLDNGEYYKPLRVKLSMKRVLFIQPQGLGDMIMMTPAITSLKTNYPKVEIGLVLANENVAQVLRGSIYCDRFFILNRKKASFFQKLKFIIKIRKEFKPDICVVGAIISPRLGEPFSWLVGAKIRVGSHSVWPWAKYTHTLPESLNMHKVEANLSLVKSVFPKCKNGQMFFEIDENSENEAYNLFDKFNLFGKYILGVHPGSDSFNKIRRYHYGYFLEVIDMFLREIPNSKCVIFLGPSDMDLETYFNNNDKVCLFKHLPIKTVAALIRRCNIFLNSDSGLGHVAAATGTPVVGIFGPGNPERTRPYGDEVLILRHNPILSCMPCIDSDRYNSCKTRKCLNDLSPEYVFNAVKDIWKKNVQQEFQV